jgi:hypothetical protein
VMDHAPIIPGEDREQFLNLADMVFSNVKPRDFIEETFARDLCYIFWDLMRARRLKTEIYRINADKGMDVLLRQLEPKWDRAGWLARKPEVINKIDGILHSAGWTSNSVMAATLFETLNEMERIDHMILMLETRKNAVFREIDRYRTAHSARLGWECQKLELREAELKGQIQNLHSTRKSLQWEIDLDSETPPA